MQLAKVVAEGKNNRRNDQFKPGPQPVRPEDGKGGYGIQQGLYLHCKRGAAEGATEEKNNYTVNGITYDTSKFTVQK